ncbi:HERV-H LTR-associating protein 1 [Centropristis striata]|uniref:HERV-H LTR-associating protein 1 n=1 Tax=Centropristis striata TaxID=184440 RepID=UPI0027E1E445|nr:HERV-H LTR-associating protein 1 [Centropristis striata]
MAGSQRANQHPRLCFIICVSTILLLILCSQALRDRRQQERHRRDELDSTEIPAEHIDPAAIDLTPLVNTLINTSQSGSRQLFSLLSVTSYSSLALHKLTLLVYNISSIRSIESNKFRRRFCYCVTNETNDLTDFTAILLDVMGNSTSYLHELFKSASILSVSQRNNSDCIYICVMAGKMGREVPELWEVGAITPLFNQTIVEGPHRVANVSSFRLPVEWHQLPTNLSHISPSGMSSMLTSRVHSTAHVSPPTMDETAATTAKITTALPPATSPQPATITPQRHTTTQRLGTTQRVTTEEMTTATKKTTSSQSIISMQPTTILQVTTASTTTEPAQTKSSANHGQCSINYIKSSTNHRKSSTNHRKSSINHSRSSTNHRKSSANHRKSSANHRKSSTNHRKSSINHSRSSTNHRKSSTNHRKSSTNHRKSSTNHRKSPTNHRKSPTNHRKSSTNHRKSPANHRKISANHRKSSANHSKSTVNHIGSSTNHAGPTVPRRTTVPLSRRTTTSSMSEETEKAGCPWRRPELPDASLSASMTTVSAHKLQPCVLELCKFFSQCLCRPFSHKTRMKRYCDDSHLWYEKHTSEVCRRVRRVSFSRNLKQRCLTKMCSKL